MCIPAENSSRSTARVIHRETPLVGYREFSFDQGRLCSTFRSTRFSIADNATVDDPRQTGDLGFHSLHSAKQLREYRRGGRSSILVRVLVWGNVMIARSFKGVIQGYRSTGLKVDAILPSLGIPVSTLKRIARQYHVSYFHTWRQAAR